MNWIKLKIYQGEDLLSEVERVESKYDNGFLRYEGEFKNGKRNGYGHEYNSLHIIVYEGEYLNGKRNGKGKEFDPHNGKIIFFGEYLNGKRNGKGKEFYYGNLKFEGEYLNGERLNDKRYDKKENMINILKTGKGFIKEYDDKGELIFEGEYLNGKKWKKERLIL